MAAGDEAVDQVRTTPGAEPGGPASPVDPDVDHLQGQIRRAARRIRCLRRLVFWGVFLPACWALVQIALSYQSGRIVSVPSGFGLAAALPLMGLTALPAFALAGLYREHQTRRLFHLLEPIYQSRRAKVLLPLGKDRCGDVEALATRLMGRLGVALPVQAGRRAVDLRRLHEEIGQSIRNLRAMRIATLSTTLALTVWVMLVGGVGAGAWLGAALGACVLVAVAFLVPRMNRDYLYHSLVALSLEQRAEMLLPFIQEGSSDARRVVQPLIRDLGVVSPTEVVPVGSPGGGGCELAPSHGSGEEAA